MFKKTGNSAILSRLIDEKGPLLDRINHSRQI